MPDSNMVEKNRERLIGVVSAWMANFWMAKSNKPESLRQATEPFWVGIPDPNNNSVLGDRLSSFPSKCGG